MQQDTQEESIANKINLTPMIDMVFILLIFFVVTASFVKESGVDVSRPTAKTASVKEQANIMVAITRDDEVWIDNRRVDVHLVRAHIERLHAQNPEGSVIILADEQSRTGLMIQVLDQARLAGVENVAIAASQPNK